MSFNHAQGASQSQSQSTMREEEEGLEELAPEEEERLMSGFADAVTSLQLTLANCSLKRSPESLETVAISIKCPCVSDCPGDNPCP